MPHYCILYIYEVIKFHIKIVKCVTYLIFNYTGDFEFFISLANVRDILTVVSIITYVHDTFKSEEVHIHQIATDWEHLTVEVSHNIQHTKKYYLLILLLLFTKGIKLYT